MRFQRCLAALLFLIAASAPLAAGAHEVYVLDKETVIRLVAADSPNPFGAVATNQKLFAFYALVGFLLVSTVFFVSLTHGVERFCRPFLMWLKPWAPIVVRVVFGVCLISSARHFALFGPELPLNELAGSWAAFMQFALYATGICVTLGVFTRAASFVALAIYGFACARYGTYMLTYTTYLGDALFGLIIGGGTYALERRMPQISLRSPFSQRLKHMEALLEPYAFLALRVAFGLSIAFSAFYAKFLHSELAIETVMRFGLTDYFPFDPLFTVLGAFIVEFVCGVFIAIGFEVRHTALFMLFWITMSSLYFNESLWPHVALVGVPLAIAMRGYDRYTFEGRFFGMSGKREPVL